MNSMRACSPGFPIDSEAPLCELSAFADTIIQTLRITRALLLSGRMVCLEGLDAQIGQLCARCLDLAHQDSGSLRMHLLAVRAELEATSLLLLDWHGGT